MVCFFAPSESRRPNDVSWQTVCWKCSSEHKLQGCYDASPKSTPNSTPSTRSTYWLEVVCKRKGANARLSFHLNSSKNLSHTPAPWEAASPKPSGWSPMIQASYLCAVKFDSWHLLKVLGCLSRHSIVPFFENWRAKPSHLRWKSAGLAPRHADLLQDWLITSQGSGCCLKLCPIYVQKTVPTAFYSVFCVKISEIACCSIWGPTSKLWNSGWQLMAEYGWCLMPWTLSLGYNKLFSENTWTILNIRNSRLTSPLLRARHGQGLRTWAGHHLPWPQIFHRLNGLTGEAIDSSKVYQEYVISEKIGHKPKIRLSIVGT